MRVAIGFAPVLDLAQAHDSNLHAGIVADLLGGQPAAEPLRHALASPRALLPLGVPQSILHGTLDDWLPVAIARDYVEAVRAAGDDVRLSELQGGGHMDYLDPTGEAHAMLCRALDLSLAKCDETALNRRL
jgi:pimeloyl-ACP methyl ester carboxylesterase